eukprot:TRINITY_DN96772_c0_g1_i1.p1 TRINITY_DN96772_c0_g1~~TRINITY_DN96772_c0_g1_i1.p1  ORF type:complete len:291 (+),score=27.50 TRINITY_DN96772_c0_g1_i1:23-874(+)
MLPDFLSPGLWLVVVGDNPGLESSRQGHWYAHQTNHFWQLLYDSGITSELLTPARDSEILRHNVGLTCLVKRATSTTAQVQASEFQTGFQGLRQKLSALCPPPLVACFNGKGVYQTATQASYVKLGLQPPTADIAVKCQQCTAVHRIKVFVGPSTSARAQAYTYEIKLSHFKQLLVHRPTPQPELKTPPTSQCAQVDCTDATETSTSNSTSSSLQTATQPAHTSTLSAPVHTTLSANKPMKQPFLAPVKSSLGSPTKPCFPLPVAKKPKITYFKNPPKKEQGE